MKLTLANAAAIANGARAEMIRIVQMTIAATAVELISDLSRDGHVALTEDQVFDLLDRLPARVFRSDIEELAPAVRPPAVRH
ncbi:MAG: hypothetical protein U1E43_07710 [Rhodospirillales bacterium]